jgi:RimJ/RimL family protein N-acetyltransferase
MLASRVWTTPNAMAIANHTQVGENLSLRAMTPADRDFLRVLYRSLREEELARLPAEWVEPFLDQQFDAQMHHYTTYYDTNRYTIIESGGRPIGRLFVDRWPSEIRVVDIGLLPEFRGRGIATVLFGQLFEEADRDGLMVSIHVERNNPARRLYERLGFIAREVGNEVYLLMERAAPKP